MRDKLEGLENLRELLCGDGLIHFEPSKSSVFFAEDGLHIGLIVGPEKNVSAVTHEIAHFVEMEDDRLFQKPKNWGFHYPTFEYPGGWCYNFLSTTAIMRELRTIAFQHNFERHTRVNEQSTYDSISSLVYMPDFQNLEYDKELAEEFKTTSSSMMYYDRARLKWLEDKLIEYIKMNEYSYDNFMKELERKKEIILKA